MVSIKSRSKTSLIAEINLVLPFEANKVSS